MARGRNGSLLFCREISQNFPNRQALLPFSSEIKFEPSAGIGSHVAAQRFCRSGASIATFSPNGSADRTKRHCRFARMATPFGLNHKAVIIKRFSFYKTMTLKRN